jgi:hypothetical protein
MSLGRLWNNTTFFDGTLDEVRIASTDRSAVWVAADYASQNNTLNSFGAEESPAPVTPTLTPLSGQQSTTPTFQLRGTDTVGTYLRYKIEVCADEDCDAVVRTIDQTASQTGWTGQNTQSNTAYTASSVLTSSTLASHTFQSPALEPGATYYWRGYAASPGVSSAWSAASAAGSFTTAAPAASPMLISPADTSTHANGSNPLLFQLYTSDGNSDYVQYKIDLCSTSNCSSVIDTIDMSQTLANWRGMDADGSDGFTTAPAVTGSAIASYLYQGTALTGTGPYYWRAYARDPAGSNVWSAPSAIRTFSLTEGKTRFVGGSQIRGGTVVTH